MGNVRSEGVSHAPPSCVVGMSRVAGDGPLLSFSLFIVVWLLTFAWESLVCNVSWFLIVRPRSFVYFRSQRHVEKLINNQIKCSIYFIGEYHTTK